MEQFLSYFTLDIIGITLLSILLITLIIQIFFYIQYYKKPVSYFNKISSYKEDITNLPSVSVIIVAKDESENLARCLPSILNQDYPDYEVIVVNDGSTDESEFLLKSLKKEYPYLYSTFSPYSDANETIQNKVLPLTIGIKAARKDILLFTEADSLPMTNQWIKSMMNNLAGKDIVIGYSRFTEGEDFSNKTALFDNLIFTLQYMSMAIKNKPFAGLYKNLAYKKHLFFDNKGFSATLNYDNAEEVFVNHIMTNNNTAVALDQDSYVSTELDSFSHWRKIKTAYSRAKFNFKGFTAGVFSLETFSRYLFYLITIASIAYSSISLLWVYLTVAILFFIIRYTVQVIILNKAADHFLTTRFHLALPFLDTIQPYYNSYFSRISKSKKRRKK
ncbi:cellulose synthase/poly-beta-1,6-N-acetylglucosamine synthase-like glycosyltransferase [Dysgonomonas alginatilytica]|uniref:Cellulose synthase/poly-beta-1,6-N-acetylglucosamine synthase-like glycosyltransferase n=1 Tax=Dysgonomonas alginatilytica TaxID=1605892 RepID=A0A2V3PRA1_9BACT|nr:glycosyltransferase [Dysgonomonas alginatilytica]PXV64676.1 cellulose synthase/poly-beta-1,6-N-acetylglucosamine synthase-like glycosyltransferase [Dysgonomonas alginatilytica]